MGIHFYFLFVFVPIFFFLFKHESKPVYLLLFLLFIIRFFFVSESYQKALGSDKKTLKNKVEVVQKYLNGYIAEYENIRFYFVSNEKYHQGDILFVEGKLKKIYDRTNPGEFSLKNALLQKETFLIFNLKNEKLIKKSEDLRYIFLKNIEKKAKNFDRKYFAFIKATIFGKKSDLDSKIKKIFFESGLGHFLTLSGMHVGLIIFLLWTILSQFLKNFDVRFLIIFTVLFIYSLFVGFSPPIFRASLIALIGLWGYYKSEYVNYKYLLFIIGIFNLISFPLDAFKVGFWLSYSAIFGFIYFPEKLLGLFSFKNRVIKKSFRVFTYYLSPVFSTLPFSVFFFGKIPIFAVFNNILLLFFLIFLFYTSFFVLFLMSFSKLFAEIIAKFASDFYELLLFIISYFAQFPKVENISILSFLIIYIFVLLFLKPSKKTKIVFLFILFFLIPIEILRSQIENKWLNIRILNLGQAQSLIVSNNGETIIYDAGKDIRKRKSLRNKITDFIQHKNIGNIKYLIISHNDFDHHGNKAGIISDNIFGHDKASRFVPTREIFSVGKAKFFRFTSETEFFNENNNSVVLKFQFGNFSGILTGDIFAKREFFLVKKFRNLLQSNFLLVAHHGSKSSSSQNFLKKVKPDVSAISASESNFYGHPDPDVLARLSPFGEILETSKNGYIHIISDGYKFYILPSFISKIFF
jgi:competence protein ComEC